jgi:fructuronate reductase
MRLSRGTLSLAAPGVRRPGFDPAMLAPGIVHLGCGAFHRAHQALATQRAVQAEWGPWGITAISLVSPGTRDALAPQDGLYTLLEQGPQGMAAEIVGTLRQVLYAPEAPQAVVAAMADPATRIVTLTVTEKGYCLDPASVRLRPDHPDILADLERPELPRSAIGLLAAGLAAVRAAGGRPPVVITCDNLAANGPTLRQAVIDYAALRDDALAGWIAGAVPFPGTMVDRIVPAATQADRDSAAALTGLEDRMPVAAEPFLQWEIEAFDGPRPRWEAGGARFVADVGPWETTKLRLLNGAHSALAYLGGLGGLATVADAMADAGLRGFARALMLQEAAPTLPAGHPDAAAYAAALLHRWDNPAIRHLLRQIATDGSRKLPQRLLAPLYANLAAGRPSPRLSLAVAAWMRWASGRDLQGKPIPVADPLAARMAELAAAADGTPDGLVAGFLTLAEVFGPDAAERPRLRDQLVAALRTLQTEGALAAAARLG